jgi:alkanesulfonate monooxygenase SsuD/methylene tetrahydromethanopterin reductase-like flavin-dependent oxidoreductase (luciferase family)
MRFSYAEGMTQAKFYAPLAQAAETAGYTSMTVADSLIYPKESDSKYPYTDTGDRAFLDGKEFIETMVLCAHLFAVTTTLRLTPFVLKLPIRPPVLVAKQASSLAFMSVNRLGLGDGLSPWPEDFEALGVPWERRGKRTDECMDILKGLTSGEFFSYSGEFFQIESLKQCPAAPAPIPLLVGGHADPALRRAVVRGDGWMHGGGDPADLDPLLAKLQQFRQEEERIGLAEEFQIHVISIDGFSLDGVKRLEDKGVTDVIVGFRIPYIKGADTEPLDAKIRNLEWFAENVIAKA